ncbi:retrovirus-related pol polyprotein from transposon TNT 1-94 [Tanacetum coccineum]|uniref:Retrovirus-related pol polyprotein from transposon TNT 1-94 n=1 Tax=Tanacetum coccineum TaxID=301880 RepID=A0ABQ5C2Z8_9ASTR
MSNHATSWDKVNNESNIVNESLTAELEIYKERVKILEQRFNVDLSGHEKFIDSQMDDMIRMKNKKFAAFETKIDTLKQALSKHRIKPILYDGNMLSNTHDVFSVLDDEETLILAEESRLKIVEKQNDPIMKKEKNNITPIDYSELNKLAEDFGKRFVPQQELSAEQKFWLQSSDNNSEEPSTSNTPVKIKVLSELPKLQGKDTVISNLKETILSLRENANPAKLKKYIDEIETINIELEHTLKNELRKLKGKTMINTVVSKPHATTIALGMFKLDLEPLALKVLKNKDAHLDYIKHSREHADIFLEIVKSTRALRDLDSNLDSACKSNRFTGASGSKLKAITKNNKIHRNHQVTTRPIKFTSTKVVPLKETTTKSVVIPTQGIMVYSRRPKALKSVGQFCDSDLEVAFRKHTYFVRNLKGVDLLTGSRETNLYTLSIGDMMKSSPICLLSKASKTKSWLWHRCLSHLNFGTINQLAKQGLVRGLPKLKFEKDHLCSTCSLGKSKKQSHKPKFEDTNQEKLYLLHMELCGPMCVESINGKKYILIIGIEFVNQTLRSYYKDVGISYETSRTPQQNGVVERQNQTLVEAARTMLIYANAPLFLWAEAVATTCYTQNYSLIRLYHGKKPYELLHDRKPNLSYLLVFGALCYPTNDSEDLGKLKAKADVDFDELTTMASKQSSLGPVLNEMTPGTLSSGLVPQPPSSIPFVPPIRNDWDTLLQPLFDEYFHPSPCVDHPVPEVAAHVPAVSTGTPSSISVDQDVPSPKELNEFELLKVWELVSRPDHVMIITLKWIYKVKLDELGAICIFLAFAAHMNMVVYQMDAKTAFLNGILRVEKFSKRTVDPTLFIRREGKDILLVQIYVDDIIFASTKPDLCEKISEIMCLKFKMSMMGKMSFFLGLSISQSHRGIFLNQSKYALEIIKKYGMETSDPVDTLMVEKSELDADPQGKEVDPIGYRGMIGSLMYLASSRLDLQFAVCMCARYQTLIVLVAKILEEVHLEHIDIRYHFIKEQVENEVVELYFVRTEYQLADIFTKALGRERLVFLINKLGMRSMSPEMLKSLADEEHASSGTLSRRVQGVDFDEVRDDEATLTFLLSLGYKGPLHKHPNMYVDHMHQPWRTLASIINKCLFDKISSNDRLRKSRIDILWGMFYRENEYGLSILETMLTDGIKQSESYHVFIKYFIGQIPPTKSKGKGSKGKKTADTIEEDIDVSKELDPEPARKRTASRRVEAARQVHDTHARIVTEPVPEPARRRPLELKESKKTSRRQLGTRGSSEETGVSLGVPDESTIVPATSSEGTESEYSEEEDDDETIKWVDTDEEEEKKNDDDDKRIDLK